MPVEKFGSAWRGKAFGTTPDELLHVADPSHAQNQGDPNPVWQAPADTNNQADFLYTEDAVVGDWFPEGPGMILNTTPVDHNDGFDNGSVATDLQAQQVNERTAGTSFGADRQDAYNPPFLQDYTTRYLSPRFEGLPGNASTLNPVTSVRGLNAEPENNPEGFRLGWVEQTFVDRKLQVAAGRDHDRRWVTPNLPYDTPDQGTVGGPYGNPFTSLAKAMSTISQTPMMRREPVSISDSVTVDGSEQGYDSQPGDWVAG